MKQSAAEILHEYGPFPGVDHVHGVTYDGQHVWFASGARLNALDPASGTTLRSIDVAAHAGTAFDGRHLFQLADARIQKIDPKTGRVLATIPAPGSGSDSGLAWAEGTLWVGQHRGRKIHQVDPQTGAVLRTIESNRFVTGVTWVDGDLWHGTWEGDESELRHIDPRTGEVLERLEMPPGTGVSGLESDGGDQFFCGGGSSGKVRVVRRPRRASAAQSISAWSPKDELFFAVQPHAAVMPSIEGLITKLPTQYGLSGRRRPAELLHVSLTAVGFRPDDPGEAVSLARQAGDAIKSAPFGLAFDHLGSFGGRNGYPLVLCRGNDRAAPVVLWESLRAAIKNVGLKPETGSRYRPHMTLLYDRKRIPEVALDDPITWMVCDFVLIHSLYGKGQHECLDRWPLRG